MADVATTRTLKDGRSRLVVQLTGKSDGTGESAITKVDKSTFLATDGAEPASLDIERIDYVISGYAHVELLWDHTTDDSAIVLPTGAAELHFDDRLGGEDYVASPLLTDPRSAGGTGDLLLTSASGATTGRYSIFVYMRKQPD